MHEGLDPVTLRGLYIEVGIHVPSPKLQNPSTSTGLASTRQIGGKPSLPERPPVSENATPVLPTPEGSDHIQGAAPNNAIDVQPISPGRTEKATKGIQKSQPETLPIMTVLPEPPPNEKNDTVVPKKPSPKAVTQTKPQQVGSTTEKAADKLLDRKEYIAKLMAAKGGKGAIAKPIKHPLAKANPVSRLSPTTPTTQIVTPGKSTSKPPSIKLHTSETEAKRAAQTELARKKIEALKQSNMSKMEQSTEKQTQQLPVSAVQPIMHQRDPTASSDKKPIAKPAKVTELLVKSQNAIPSQVPTPFTPSTSFFSSLGRSKNMSIPGLLMGNHSSLSLFPSANSPADSLVDATPKTLPFRRTSQPESDSGLSLPDQPSNISTQGQSKQVTPINQSASNAEPKTIKPSTIGTISQLEESRPATPNPIAAEPNSSRKRPTASDFIDAPPSRLKRRLGSHQQDDIILVLSDEGETEDESDRMNVTATASFIPTANFSAEVKTAKPIRDLPPLTDFPPRPKSLVNASTTTSPVLPLGKSTEQEVVLKAKEEQILAMQRRIAEMEMKRASKRAAEFSSPESSQVKHVARSISNPPQPQQVVPTPTQPPTGTVTPLTDIEAPQSERRSAGVVKLQLPFEPEVNKSHPVFDVQSRQVTEAERLQIQHDSVRIEEIERSLLRTTEEVESINVKLLVARREIVATEQELENLLGQRRKYTDELDLLKQANKGSISTVVEVSPSDKEMTNRLSLSKPQEDQSSK